MLRGTSEMAPCSPRVELPDSPSAVHAVDLWEPDQASLPMDLESLRRRLLKLAALRFGDCALHVDRGIDSLTVALADCAEGVVVAAAQDGASPPSSENSRKLAQRPNILVFRAAAQFPFAQGQFNVVVAVFPFVRPNDRRMMSKLQEIRRVLLPRGKFVGAYWEGGEHVWPYDALAGSYQAFRTLVCEAGFEGLRDDGLLRTSGGIVHCMHAHAPRSG